MTGNGISKRSLLGIALNAMVVIAFLAGCAAPATEVATEAPEATEPPEAEATEPPVTEPAEPLEFAVVLQAIGIPFFSALERGAIQAGHDFGVHVEVVGPPLHDPERQIAMFEAYVQRGVDGIVVGAPVPVWDTTINAAIDQGMIVLTTNSDAPDSRRIAGWQQDFEDTGRIMGQTLVELMGEEGVVGMGWCVSGAVPLVRRLDGFSEVISQYPGITTIGPIDVGDDASRAYEGWSTLISTNPEMTGTFGLCATDPQAAGEVAQDLARDDLIVIGYDLQPVTLELIRDGWVDMALGQAPYLQGYLPIMALANYFQNGTPLPEGLVPMPMEIVTADNAADYIPRETDSHAERVWYSNWLCENYPNDYPAELCTD
ncbi:MAG TPA: substrate-binding domain-containing protein [Anaerolineales bacterium]|nr:substrate-binding domain-containing protein [Anaerolineales bacterium]